MQVEPCVCADAYTSVCETHALHCHRTKHISLVFVTFSSWFFVVLNVQSLFCFVASYVPSQGDGVVFEALSGCPPTDLPHVLRWYNHITSFGDEKATFPGSKKDLDSYGGKPVTNGTKKDDDDDFDLFGSDSEEVTVKISW